MKRVLLLLFAALGTAWAGDEAFNGRWVIEPVSDNNGRVLWLEINGAGSGG